MKSRSARSVRKKKKFITRGNKKVVYRVTLLFSLFFVSAVFLSGLLMYRRLSISFTSALSSNDTTLNQSIIEDEFPTIVYANVGDIRSDPLVIKELKYLVFDKNNNQVLTYNIPVSLKYDVAGKYGEEELAKILAIGALNSQGPLIDSTVVLKNSVLKIFGFKVDKFIIAGDRSAGMFEDLFGNGSFLDLLKLKDFSKLSDDFKTDLSLEEFYNLFSFIKSIPNDRLISKFLTEKDLLDPAIIDTSLQDITLDSNISVESKSISILNGTNISGVASLGSRVVKNIGGRVVALGNADKTYSQSVIIADDVNSQTVKLLSRTFGITNVVLKSQNTFLEHEVDRSDVVVIMGFDTIEQLY